jgi:HEAT repeat protein
LDDGEFPLHARYDHPDANPALIAAWAEHLSDLAWSDDVEIRRWLASSVPIRTGTPSDARIDEVIARLLTDEDEDIRWDAEYAAEQRREAVGNP